jgi:lipoic acid synthetase
MPSSPEAPPLVPSADGSSRSRRQAAAPPTLRIRWLGTVRYRDAHALQRALFERSADDHLLLLEHPAVYTLGVRADRANVLLPPEDIGAELVVTDRGGDVTYHGPGQLVGYPILTVPGKRGGGMADTVAYVCGVEQVLIDALADLGLPGCGRVRGLPGVWVDPDSDQPRKIAAIGVRLARTRSMHGFALNVAPDLTHFDRIVPCGIADKGVTSLAAEGIVVSMREVVDAVAARAAARWGRGNVERADLAWRVRPDDLSAFTRGEGPGAVVGRGGASYGAPAPVGSPGGTAAGNEAPVRLLGRLAEAGVQGGLPIVERKPEWMRVKADHGPELRRVRSLLRELELTTVCEEAGCPNIWECWNDGTATFMINGERCTRACGFCLVDTRKPDPIDPDEPRRLAEAVERLGLSYAVVTAVARDDLADGGAAAFAACVAAVRERTPHTRIEVLIPDCKGDPDALATIFDARPDVVNHNIETVLRLQRAVRPSASYARSLAVLSRAKAAGLTTKSSIIVGMGETADEVVQTMADLAAVAVDIVTIGQYLRPTSNHLPVARWWTPDELTEMKRIGEHDLGLRHVEASPLTRSSYHAKQAAASTGI